VLFDQRDAEAARILQKIPELARFAGIGQRQHHIRRHDHAEVAVARLARVNELRGRSGGRQGGSDLSRDMAALAHAGDDDAALRGVQGFEGVDEAVAERRVERRDAFGLQLEHPARRLQAVARYSRGGSAGLRRRTRSSIGLQVAHNIPGSIDLGIVTGATNRTEDRILRQERLDVKR